jgi:hypothetical protein
MDSDASDVICGCNGIEDEIWRCHKMKNIIYKITLFFVMIFAGLTTAQEYRFSNYYFSGNTTVKSTTSDLKINASIGSTISGVSQSNGIMIRSNPNNCYFLFSNSEIDIPEVKTVPNQFCLNQNYPNPFNPTTVIKYSIPNEGIVVLSIFNMLGQKVSVLVNENKSPGTYEATWDASKFSSGVYIYYLTSGSYSNSKKLLLLK